MEHLLAQNISTMSKYKLEFPFPVAFPPQGMTNVLAEWLSSQGVKQAHVAGNVVHPEYRISTHTI